MKFEKKTITKFEDLTKEEQIEMKRRLTKMSKEVKIKDTLLYGKEAIQTEPKGKVIKGNFNWRMQPRDPLVLK